MMNKEKMIAEFEKMFGYKDEVSVYFAPGRVNLIGEHTDYNGGHVFPCALTLGIYGAVRKRMDNKIRFYSLNMPEVGMIETSLEEFVYQEEASWTNYPKGVFWSFIKNGALGENQKGIDMLIYGDIPKGSGLSSSAALEVLTGIIIKDLYHLTELSMTEVALLGQYAENNYNGMNCGIMDQFASAMGKEGHAIFLDTNTLAYEYAPIVLEKEQIIITNSNVKHTLVDSAYNARRKQCEEALEKLKKVVDIHSLGELSIEDFEKNKDVIEDEATRKRAKHAVYENQRTIQAMAALKAGEIEVFGRLMNESHVSLRDDYEVSSEEVDTLVDIAWKLEGVLGSRITGAGFGGCTVSIVKKEAVENFIQTMVTAYKEKTGFDAECYIVNSGDSARKL